MGKITNMKITNVSLTMADHGCLTFWITVEGAGTGCNIGGYCIGHGYLGSKEFSDDHGGGLVAMMKIMDVVGVERWEDLKGKYCRVEDNGLGSPITKIGNIINNNWFDLKEYFENFCKENE